MIEEVHPTLSNLVGRIEHLAVQGALVTNFRLIKPGSLHRANGGALMIDLRNLLTEPLSWAALKRALLRQEIVIEDAARFMGMTTTVTLEPDPIPLDVKVVLFGDRMLYYMLVAADPDTAQHFKVLADFDDDVDRSPASEMMIARLIGSIAANAGLLPLDRGGVARVIEHAARLADDAGKLTLLVESIHDLVAEASHCAGQAGRDVVTRDDVEQAIAQQRRRASRVEERAREMILRDIALIATTGSSVGQVNGLSVMALAGHAFGRPTRITARVRPGTGRIVDIEREVELGGPLHSKGVLILSGFLAGRYALDVPMSLYASLVFEQSYGGVDGDSASSAELYSLLSALAEVPLRQDLAVTGSVDQHGVVQAIGGVNEKIEGFFDVCAARGLTGTQGVLIPHSNAQHLMLRADVVEACAAGRFAVYPVRTIDEGIRLLTGREAGERGERRPLSGRQREPAGGGPARRIRQGAAGVRPRRIRRDMSMAIEPRQRRVILHLHHGATERAIIRAAAELAQMLGVALHGVFLEDEALPELAELPFIREFRLGTGAWQKLDRQQLAEEQRAAAAEARRLLDEAAAALWGSRGCSRSSAATRRCSSPPRRRPATSSWWRSRDCRRNVWSTPRRDGWRRRMAVPPR